MGGMSRWVLVSCIIHAYGGTFKTALEAAKKYNELAKQYHGEFAWLNRV